MNRLSCEREEQTSAAILGGVIDPEIVSHAQGCPACSDILQVHEFLRNSGALSQQERSTLPDAGVIWRKAQVRPIRWMTVLACVAFACSPWLSLVLPLAQDLASSWTRTLDSNLLSLSKVWLATPNEPVILLGITGTMILLGLSSWLMLRQE
jgi:hypothetical protein